ncbi:TRAP transporter large permease subunit [Roseomonas chloroacetimidivorans]|uniref:TRAP transporter large permease n=1 Tax=Roseomonas chloroacetimidivorans TaxID=1766656 RepID=UPI003C73C8B2
MSIISQPVEATELPRGTLLGVTESALTVFTEGAAALLMVVELVVLGAGVAARYLFGHPLVWSDELASVLFLWLAMFGSVIALRRSEHMRLTMLVSNLPAPWRGRVEALGAAITVACLIALLAPTVEYVDLERDVVTPALQMNNGLRVAAILVGGVLMLAESLLRLFRHSRRADALGASAVVGAFCLGLWFAAPLLVPLQNMNLLLFFVVGVGLCVLIGTPIAFAFGAATIAYIAVTTDMPLSILVGRVDAGMSELILLAVPMFIFLGMLIEITGLARALVNFMIALLGHVRGGLSYVLLAAMYLVSGISGAKAADMAAIVPALFPGMKARGAHPGELVAQLGASGAMSETIPPSLVLITIGSVTGVSIAGLFTGGMLPALVCALALVIMCRIRSRHAGDSVTKRASYQTMLRTGLIALPALVLPFLIRAAVVEGVATATEVSTVGVVYTILAGLLIYRQFDVRRIYPMLVDTAALSGAILLIIGMATAMGWALTQSGFSQQLVSMMIAMPGGKIGFFAVSILAFAVLGSLLEGIPAIVLFGPLLFPAARALGVNEIHYAITVVLAMGLGLFAPPFGLGFYFSCAIGGAAPDQAMTRIWPYLGILLLAVVVVAAVPWLSIGLL